MSSFILFFLLAQADLQKVVIAVPGYELEQAGIVKNDYLVGWFSPDRVEALNKVSNLFDAWFLDLISSNQGPVTLRVVRNGKILNIATDYGFWKANYLSLNLNSEPGSMDEPLGQAFEYRLANDFESEYDTWKRIFTDYSGVMNNRNLAIAYTIFAQTCLRTNKLEEGLEQIEKAETIPELPVLLQAYLKNLKGLFFRSLSQHDKGIESIRNAVDLIKEDYPNSPLLGAFLYSLGQNIYFKRHYAEAGQYFEKSLAIRNSINPNNLATAWSLWRLGTVAYKLGDLDGAFDYHIRALEIRKKFPSASKDLKASYISLGNLAYSHGNYSEAEKYYWNGFEGDLEREPNGENSAIYYNNLGNIAFVRRNFTEAIRNYEKAVEIRRNTQPGSNRLAINLTNLGNAYLENNDPQNALSSQKEAFLIRKKNGPDTLASTYTYLGLGLAYLELSDYANANQMLVKTLRIRQEKAKDTVEHALAGYHLAGLKLKAGDVKAAELLMNEMLPIFQKRVPMTYQEAEAHQRMAEILLFKKENQRAFEHVVHAIHSFEEHMLQVGGLQEIRMNLGSNFRDYYKLAFKLSFTSGNYEDAFEFFERSNSQELFQLASKKVQLDKALESIDQTRFNTKFNTLWSDFQATLKLGDKKKLRELKDQIMAVRRAKLQAIQTEVSNMPSVVFENNFSLTQIRNSLDPDVFYMGFYILEKSLFLIGVTKSDLHIKEVNIQHETLFDLISRFRQLHEIPTIPTEKGMMEHIVRTDPILKIFSKKLYKILFSPLEKEFSQYSKLAIISDAEIHLLPFASLVNREGRYLVQSHSFFLGSSFKLINRQQSLRHRKTGSLYVGVGDVPVKLSLTNQFPGKGSLAAFIQRSGQLATLPFSGEEIRKSSKLFENAKNFIAEEAKKKEIMKWLPKAQIIHLASHGLIDDEFPLSSGILFYGDEGSSWLQAWEVQELVSLKSDLTILSGCNTALGKIYGGEGFVGLTSAFQIAGSRCVLGTLWPVTDQITSRFIFLFLYELGKGTSTSEALSKIQRDLQVDSRSIYSFPGYWAGYQIYGDWK